MNTTLDDLTKQVLALPSDDRVQLVDRLVESLAVAPDEATRSLWVAEATRRRDEIRSGAVKPIDGAKALEQVRRSLSR